MLQFLHPLVAEFVCCLVVLCKKLIMCLSLLLFEVFQLFRSLLHFWFCGPQLHSCQSCDEPFALYASISRQIELAASW